MAVVGASWFEYFLNIRASWSRAIRVSVEMGLRGLAGDGLRSAAVRSFAAVTARLAGGGTVMMSVNRYHDKVSAMRSAAVSKAQTQSHW